jgi:hypothetical protein
MSAVRQLLLSAGDDARLCGRKAQPAPVAQRHAEHFAAFFERAEADLETRPMPVFLEPYSRRIDDVRSALDWAFSADGDGAVGVALTVASAPIWVRLSLFPLSFFGRMWRFSKIQRSSGTGHPVLVPDVKAEFAPDDETQCRTRRRNPQYQWIDFADGRSLLQSTGNRRGSWRPVLVPVRTPNPHPRLQAARVSDRRRQLALPN